MHTHTRNYPKIVSLDLLTSVLSSLVQFYTSLSIANENPGIVILSELDFHEILEDNFEITFPLQEIPHMLHC